MNKTVKRSRREILDELDNYVVGLEDKIEELYSEIDGLKYDLSRAEEDKLSDSREYDKLENEYEDYVFRLEAIGIPDVDQLSVGQQMDLEKAVRVVFQGDFNELMLAAKRGGYDFDRLRVFKVG